MPSYTYKCESCKQAVDIFRSMKDSELLPDSTECEVHCTVSPEGNHKWQKQFAGTKVSMVRGKNWNYRKPT